MPHYLPLSSWDKMSSQDRKDFLSRLQMDVGAILLDPQSGTELVELRSKSAWYATQPSYRILSGESSYDIEV